MSNGVSELTCVIFREVYAFALAHGIRELVAVVSLPVERIFRRLGLPIERLGHRQAVDLGRFGASVSASIWMNVLPVPFPNPCSVITSPIVVLLNPNDIRWPHHHKKIPGNIPGINASL